MKLALLIPDTHKPYEDKKAYNLMMSIASQMDVDEVIILGDYADFYSVSSHAKDPSVFNMLTKEVESVLDGLDEIDKTFKNAKKIFIEGNHEYRLERYLCDKAPALFGVTSTEHLLKLNQRPGWRFVPYSPHQSHKVLGSHLTARHESLGTSAKATSQKALCSLVYGHIHRIEESHMVGLDGTNHVAFSVGWLGDKRKDKIFSYVKTHWQWQLGFGLVWVDPQTRYFYHQKIHILDNYTCVVNGKKYKA
jgi:UDP-2,3-diacylglucosamine pyrophosphatase LpxH